MLLEATKRSGAANAYFTQAAKKQKSYKANHAESNVNAAGPSNTMSPARNAYKRRARQLAIERKVIAKAREMGIPADNAKVVAARVIAAQQSQGPPGSVPAANTQDNGGAPMDTMGNMPVYRFNRLFDVSSTDRKLINIQENMTNATDESLVLYQAGTAPFTLTGFRWRMTTQVSGSVFLFLVILREGESLPAIDTTSGQVAFTPEKDVVLYAKHYSITGVSQPPIIEGTNKQYKMHNGDQLVLLWRADFGGGDDVLSGIVEFWSMY